MPPYDPHDPNANPDTAVNAGTPIDGSVILLAYDPAWAGMYEDEAAQIRKALGTRVLQLEHFGSTSIPGMVAKPCIDMLLAVQDSGDEPAYLDDLTAAGFVLRRREPEWHEHRVFKGARVNLNLHVWTFGDPIIDEHLRFRDWLRKNQADHDLYATAKQDLAQRHWTTMQDYADAKHDVVTDILRRAERHTSPSSIGPT
jgi:GrpB-like predicted nucleotidyltransferase (UPF0157 family)